MRFRTLLTAEGALVLGGLGIAASGVAIDVWATGAGLIGGGSSGHDALLALNLTILALAFIAFGLLMAQPTVFLRKGYRRVYVAAILLIADGLIHMAVIAPHLEAPIQAAFFGVVAFAQVVGGLTLAESRRPMRDDWILLSAFLIVLFVVSRTTAVPYLFNLEPLDFLGIVSKICESLLILVLLTMRRPAFDEGLRAVAVQGEREEGLPSATR